MIGDPQQLDLFSSSPLQPAAAVHDLLPDILLAAWRKRGTERTAKEGLVVEFPTRPRPTPDTPTRRIA
ncbi:MAG: hypothetical protein WBA36_18915 [Mesorhizobium sp.]